MMLISLSARERRWFRNNMSQQTDCIDEPVDPDPNVDCNDLHHSLPHLSAGRSFARVKSTILCSAYSCRLCKHHGVVGLYVSGEL